MKQNKIPILATVMNAHMHTHTHTDIHTHTEGDEETSVRGAFVAGGVTLALRTNMLVRSLSLSLFLFGLHDTHFSSVTPPQKKTHPKKANTKIVHEVTRNRGNFKYNVLNAEIIKTKLRTSTKAPLARRTDGSREEDHCWGGERKPLLCHTGEARKNPEHYQF